jgi:DNA polymerase-1
MRKLAKSYSRWTAAQMYRAVRDVGEVREYLSGKPLFAFDFETAPDEPYRLEERAALDPHKSHIVGISFSVEENSGIYVPLAHKVGENVSDTTELWKYLADLFASGECRKVAHNLAFEAAFLYARGIVIQEPCYDTIAAAQLTLKGNTGFRKLSDSGLKTLVPELFKTDLPTFGEVTLGGHFDDLDPADAETVRYACADADFTLRLYHIFNAWFDRWMPRHRFITECVESPTAVYVGMMKYNGLLVDTSLMTAKAAECDARLDKLKAEIEFIIGDVNIGANCSTSDFKNYLYKNLGLPVVKTTAKYQEAADDETMILLAEWCETNRPELVPLFKLVQEYRKLGKVKSTYIDGYSKYINAATGRIHADLMPLATETGRFAARNPNLQNMPRAGADDVGVRNFFIAPEGKVLLSADLSQIELRIGALYCRDDKMLETYRTGGDIHDQTATVVFGAGKHDKEQRTIAKNVNFGTFYGLFPSGLQRTLKFKAGLDASLEKCETIIANLKTGYPKLSEWQADTVKAAKKSRYTETWLGRRRYLPNITSQDWGKRSFSERCALNTPIQGTAADLLKLAMGRILEGLPERPWLRPLLQIHDEVVFELPEDKASEAAAFIKECMEARPFPECGIPIIAEASIGTRFGEMGEML